jgi:hypothetical protein
MHRSRPWSRLPVLLASALPLAGLPVQAAEHLDRYYAHETVVDEHGVIAPWYSGQNGQFDYRVRIAAETLKRYPWADLPKAPIPAPEYVYSGAWAITAEGTITIPPIHDWANGDFGQRAAYVLSALVDYYRYTGDAVVFGLLDRQITVLLELGCTDDNHPWPRFPITVPIKGKPYGQADPAGLIQIDIAAEVGLGLLRAYQLTGRQDWFEAACHWGETIATRRSPDPQSPPWGRYANPGNIGWEDPMTGGVTFVLFFLEELQRLGFEGEDRCVVAAIEDGRRFLRDELLPDWIGHDTWGRNYWDWPCPVQVENVTEFAARYLMTHPREFPNWQADTRNIMALFLNRTCTAKSSLGDVYSGAWAYPESSGCCGRSLWYGPMEVATVFAEYGVRARSEWGRELARRQQILATYDIHETGVVEDGIDGGPIVAADWFKIAHPMALKHVLGTMAWLPEVQGAARENHIMRATAVVTNVVYAPGRVEFETFDAPPHTETVLRLAFRPDSVTADGLPLPEGDPGVDGNAYSLAPLPHDDWLITVRHDGRTRVRVDGRDDPREAHGTEVAEFEGGWAPVDTLARDARGTGSQGARMRFEFTGNQVRVLGAYGPQGGLAEVILDGEPQLVGIDCWAPSPHTNQLLYYRNGLASTEHTLEIVARGTGNPASSGSQIVLQGFETCAAEAIHEFGAGGGPDQPQRWVFGRAERQDYVDSQGQTWAPATEFVTWWTRSRLPGGPRAGVSASTERTTLNSSATACTAMSSGSTQRSRQAPATRAWGSPRPETSIR